MTTKIVPHLNLIDPRDPVEADKDVMMLRRQLDSLERIAEQKLQAMWIENRKKDLRERIRKLGEKPVC